MSNLIYETYTHDVFGNCLMLKNGVAELAVSLDFGPRVLHYALAGKENMMYNDLTKRPLGDPLETYGGDQCILYGGHRIWLSPEVLPRCYHPDNTATEYENHDNGFIIKGAIEKFTGIQKVMNINMAEDSSIVRIDHSIINHCVWDIELGLWCITMLAPGGKEIIPMPNRITGVLHNRSISLWDYSDMSDGRVYWGKDFITLTGDPDYTQAFKLGLNNEAGWGAYFNRGQVFLKFFDPIVNGVLPDNGCNYETYTNGLMIELESLSDIKLLPPGGSISHAEEWALYEADAVPGCNENEMRGAVDTYLYKRES